MLQITSQLLHALRAHAERAYPEECCGVLLGKAEAGVKQVTTVLPLENSAPSERECRYLIAPEVMFGLQRGEREAGREILGFYHSHPDHTPEPSETDRVEAWEGWIYLIVSVREGKAAEERAWVLEDGGVRFVSEALLVVDEE